MHAYAHKTTLAKRNLHTHTPTQCDRINYPKRHIRKLFSFFYVGCLLALDESVNCLHALYPNMCIENNVKASVRTHMCGFITYDVRNSAALLFKMTLLCVASVSPRINSILFTSVAVARIYTYETLAFRYFNSHPQKEILFQFGRVCFIIVPKMLLKKSKTQEKKQDTEADIRKMRQCTTHNAHTVTLSPARAELCSFLNKLVLHLASIRQIKVHSLVSANTTYTTQSHAVNGDKR